MINKDSAMKPDGTLGGLLEIIMNSFWKRVLFFLYVLFLRRYERFSSGSWDSSSESLSFTRDSLESSGIL